VDKVWFANRQDEIPEPLLAQIGKLRNLEVFYVDGRIIRATAALFHFKNLSRLRAFLLYAKARGRSTGLSWLEGKTQLEMLHLGNIRSASHGRRILDSFPPDTRVVVFDVTWDAYERSNA
jgi:hypothetical protein